MSSLYFGVSNFSSLPPDEQAEILNGPAMQPPPGVVPNFNNPPNGNVMAQTVLGLCLALTTITVCGRLWIRFLLKKIFIGDYLLILTYALNIVYIALAYSISTSPGAFVRMWNIRVADITPILHTSFVMSHFYLSSIALIKVTILLEWIRIFVPRHTRNILFWASHSLIWINIIACVVAVISYNMACTPREYLWNKLINGSCTRIDTATGSDVISAFNLATDILTFIIPQRAIWKLHMSTKKKIGVSLTFAVGILGIAVAIVRLVVIIRQGPASDYTYDNSAVMLCSTAETTCGFLIVCIPALPKAFTLSKGNVRSPLESQQSRGKPGKSNWNVATKTHQKFVEIEEHQIYPVGRPQPTISTNQPISGRMESGILRTTHFEAKVSYEPAATSGEYTRQHVLNGLV
ncbi:hypothetical protein F5Y13DRAFT_200180 [Hypoxylon sp. FL1857]|nr:hypothetical protein F5Y13DRAFT_200180 [Hypoxylon sp. FL1857]